MAQIFNDPGVYVVEEREAQVLEPVAPEMPACIIGPLFQIADQDNVTATGTILDNDTLDVTTNDSVALSYPSLTDVDNPVDTNSVVVELVKTDGRREVLPETDSDTNTILTITESDVTVHFGDSGVGDLFTAFQDINDKWLAKSVDYTAASPDLSGLIGAEIHINYRAARHDLVGRVLLAEGKGDTQIVLGKADEDNPLGLAGGLATTVAPSTPHYYVPTKDYLTQVGGTVDEATEIGAALERIEPKQVHGVALLTSNELSHQAVINHCAAMSVPEEKMYRFAWTSKPIPTREEVMEYQSLDPATDTISEIELKNGQSDILHQYGVSISNERATVLFNEFSMTIDGEEKRLPAYYLAAAYCAFKASLPPQQGLTNYPVSGIANEVFYQKGYFKPSHLRKISNGGIFVVLQDVKDGPVNCRAQWTTNMFDNETKQVSVQYSKDAYSYGFIKTLDPLIGVNNITDSVMETIEETAIGYIDTKTGTLINSGELIAINRNESNAARVDVEQRVEFQSPLDLIVAKMVY